MSDSDFWGNILPKKKKLSCHHKLNKCMSDPFIEYTDKLPGYSCINNYECLSNICVIQDGINQCGGFKEGDECNHHN